jgi:hypothetical protein
VYTYSVKLDVQRNTVRYLATLLRAERRRRGIRKATRLLSPFRQAIFVLAWFRDRPDMERWGAGFRLARSTAYRYLDEGITVLAPGRRTGACQGREAALPRLGRQDGDHRPYPRGEEDQPQPSRSTPGTPGEPTTSAA